MHETATLRLDGDLHLRVKTDLSKRLAEIAAEHRVSKSVLARHILEQHLEGYSRKWLLG